MVIFKKFYKDLLDTIKLVINLKKQVDENRELIEYLFMLNTELTESLINKQNNNSSDLFLDATKSKKDKDLPN